MGRFASGMCFAMTLAQLTACGGDDSASLLVDIKTDLVPQVEFYAVRTTNIGGGPMGANLVFETDADGDADYIRGVRVLRLDDLAPGSLRLRVELLDANGIRVLVRDAVVEVRGAVAIVMLMARSCLGMECPSELTCSGGSCVEPSCIGGGADMCVEPECDTAADCESAVDCVAPTCEAGQCLLTQRVGACPAGEFCNPEVGCVPTSSPMVDAGLPDARPTDTGPTDTGPIDSGPMCSESPCRFILPQCGCPSDRQCQIVGATPVCGPPGDTPAGEGCMFDEDCTAGHGCIDDQCRAWCRTDGDCPTGSRCSLLVGGNDEYGSCSSVCDPIADSGCPGVNHCYFAVIIDFPDQQMVNDTLCRESGDSGLGGACINSIDCTPGRLCVNEQCAPVCRVGEDDCNIPRTCISLVGNPVVRGTEYGACL